MFSQQNVQQECRSGESARQLERCHRSRQDPARDRKAGRIGTSAGCFHRGVREQESGGKKRAHQRLHIAGDHHMHRQRRDQERSGEDARPGQIAPYAAARQKRQRGEKTRRPAKQQELDRRQPAELHHRHVQELREHRKPGIRQIAVQQDASVGKPSPRHGELVYALVPARGILECPDRQENQRDQYNQNRERHPVLNGK